MGQARRFPGFLVRLVVSVSRRSGKEMPNDRGTCANEVVQVRRCAGVWDSPQPSGPISVLPGVGGAEAFHPVRVGGAFDIRRVMTRESRRRVGIAKSAKRGRPRVRLPPDIASSTDANARPGFREGY